MNTLISEIGIVKNMKASLAGAVPDGVWYQDLKKINPYDIHQNVGFIYSVDSLHHHNYKKIQNTARRKVTW